MNKVFPTMPVSALRNNQSKVFGSLDKSPITLTSNGYDTAVLVSTARWNEMVELIARLEDSQIINSRAKEMDEDDSSWFSAEEVEKQLASRGLLNA